MTKLCPKCGYTNPGDVQRCQTCGFLLRQVCPRCGTSRSWSVERCPRCNPQVAGAADSQLFTQLFQTTPHLKLRKRYSVKGLISRSRISAVYRVIDTQSADGTSYALKEISDTSLITAEERHEAGRAFTILAEKWARIEHPNLPRIIDFFSTKGKYYVVMSLVHGWSLAHIIKEPSLSLDEEVIRNWGAQLCELLEYLHRQDPPLLFSDLKPGHVMVTRQGLVTLVDLGLTRLFVPWSDAPRDQHMAAPGLASDVHALGRVLDSLVTHRLPDKQAGSSGEYRQPRSSQGYSRGYSRQLRAIVTRATRRDPAARYQSVLELRQALLDDEDKPAQPISDWIKRKTLSFAKPTEKVPVQKKRRAEKPRRRVPREDSPTRVVSRHTERPQLRVTPRYIDLGEMSPHELRKVVVTVSNTGKRQLTGRLMSHVPWLTAPRSTFRCQPNQASKLVVSVRADDLPPETTNEPQALSVETNSGLRKWIGARAAVVQGPTLRVKEKVLDFGRVQGDGELLRQVTIFNDGDSVLKGTLRSRVSWLRVSKETFHCQPHRALQLSLALLTGKLPKGKSVEPSALLLDSDVGQERIEVRVWLVQPSLKLETTHVDFGSLLRGQAAEQIINLSNSGDGILRGVVRTQIPWLRVKPDTILCNPGEHVSHTIVIDTTKLSQGTTRELAALSIETNAGERMVSAQTELLAPQLSVSKDPLHFQDVPLGQVSQLLLPISNVGSAPLEAHAESLLEWLTISPEHFVCVPGQSVQLTVTADTAAFSRGLSLTLPEAARITSNDGTADIGVRLDILKPLLALTPSILDFGIVGMPEPVSRSLLIRNEGTGILSWNIKTDNLWVEIEPTEGQSEPGKTSEVRLTAYTLALPSETEMAEGSLHIASNGGREGVPMAITIASPRLSLDVSLLDLGTSINHAEIEGSFTIFNHGLGTLSGQIQSRVEWLTIEPSSFDCPTGRSQSIRVRGHPVGVPKGDVSEKEAIVVDSNGGQAAIDLFLGILLQPQLEIRPSPLLLRQTGETEDAEGQLTLRNDGQAAARAKLSSSTSELTLQRNACTVKPGKQIRIGVSLQRSTLPEPNEIFITVTAEASETRIPVKVVP